MTICLDYVVTLANKRVNVKFIEGSAGPYWVFYDSRTREWVHDKKTQRQLIASVLRYLKRARVPSDCPIKLMVKRSRLK